MFGCNIMMDQERSQRGKWAISAYISAKLKHFLESSLPVRKIVIWVGPVLYKSCSRKEGVPLWAVYQSKFVPLDENTYAACKFTGTWGVAARAQLATLCRILYM